MDIGDFVRGLMCWVYGAGHLFVLHHQRKMLRSDTSLSLALADYSFPGTVIAMGVITFVDALYPIPIAIFTSVIAGLMLNMVVAFVMYYPVSLWNKKSPRSLLLKDIEKRNAASPS